MSGHVPEQSACCIPDLLLCCCWFLLLLLLLVLCCFVSLSAPHRTAQLTGGFHFGFFRPAYLQQQAPNKQQQQGRQ